jgi:uncharacterized protein (TIGR02246 family)
MGRAEAPAGDRNVVNDEQALHAIRAELEAAENAGDADAIGGLLADDAVLMVPSEPVQEGREACAAFVRR